MKTFMEMVREFHDKFEVPTSPAPTIPPEARCELRIELIDEEFKELKEAIEDRNVVEVADALADLAYVVCGAALEFGIPLDRVFAEVHRSNMTKVWSDGTVHRREDGKILKPPTYSPADVSRVMLAASSEAKLAADPQPQESCPYKFLSHEFLKAMDEIGQHGYRKHGERSSQARILSGNIERLIDRHQTPAIMHHARLHSLDYEAGIPHDHFGDLLHQLAAIAYNAMMEAQLGKLVNDPLDAKVTKAQWDREDQFLSLNGSK